MSNEIGILNKNEDNKFVIFIGEIKHIVLSSGTIIEVFNEVSNSWIRTRIEFNGSTNQYYGTTFQLQIGQKVRIA